MIPEGYQLRTLTLSDYDAVLSLWKDTEGLGLGASDTREAIGFFLNHNPGLSRLILDPSGNCCGAVLAGHDGRRGYLHHLAVAKSHRGKGLGRALVNNCTDSLRALGIEKCNLFLIADNEAGRSFWLHEGWQAREDIVLIQRDLKPCCGRDRC